MNGREQLRLQVQELLLNGYTQERISAKLNISTSVTAKIVKKIRKESSQWLTNLQHIIKIH